MAQSGWIPDPDDPRAPPQDVWDAMTPEERNRVAATLPTDMPLELHPPEGDPHRKPKDKARDALDAYFSRIGRRIYVSSELVTYYPGERRFCPDILAVLDVEPHERSSWIVSREGKGLDLAIEIHVDGDREKDFETNVERYARLGITEYFILDRARTRILGYRLPPGGGPYDRIVPQAGRFASSVLDLELTIEGGLLRFYHSTAPLLFMDELVGKLDAMVTELTDARDEAARRAEEEASRAEEQATRAEEQAQRADALAAERDAARERIAALERQLAELEATLKARRDR